MNTSIRADVATIRQLAVENGMRDKFLNHVHTAERHHERDIYLYLAWDFDDEELRIHNDMNIPHNTLVIMTAYIPSKKETKKGMTLQNMVYPWESKDINTGIGKESQ